MNGPTLQKRRPAQCQKQPDQHQRSDRFRNVQRVPDAAQLDRFLPLLGRQSVGLSLGPARRRGIRLGRACLRPARLRRAGRRRSGLCRRNLPCTFPCHPSNQQNRQARRAQPTPGPMSNTAPNPLPAPPHRCFHPRAFPTPAFPSQPRFCDNALYRCFLLSLHRQSPICPRPASVDFPLEFQSAQPFSLRSSARLPSLRPFRHAPKRTPRSFSTP